MKQTRLCLFILLGFSLLFFFSTDAWSMSPNDLLMSPLHVQEKIELFTGRSRIVGWSLVFPLFVLALLIQKYRLITLGEANYALVIGRLCLVVILLLSYGTIFKAITATARGISRQLVEDDLKGYHSSVKEGLDQDYKNWSEEQTKCGNPMVFGKNWRDCLQSSFYRVHLLASYLFMYVAYLLFGWLATLFLSFLLLIAPIMISVSVVPGIEMFKYWLRYVAELACWHVVMNALIKLQGLAGFGMMHEANLGGYLERIAACALFTASILVTPFLTSALVKGSGIGSAGSAILGASLYLATMAKPVFGKGGQLISGVYGKASEMFSGIRGSGEYKFGNHSDLYLMRSGDDE